MLQTIQKALHPEGFPMSESLKEQLLQSCYKVLTLETPTRKLQYINVSSQNEFCSFSTSSSAVYVHAALHHQLLTSQNRALNTAVI